MRRMILGLALLAACGDNLQPITPHDAGADAVPQSTGPCLPRPDDLARPPSGSLPCELLPPGFTAAARTP